jgi:hypothetical protein
MLQALRAAKHVEDLHSAALAVEKPARRRASRQ